MVMMRTRASEGSLDPASTKRPGGIENQIVGMMNKEGCEGECVAVKSSCNSVTGDGWLCELEHAITLKEK